MIVKSLLFLLRHVSPDHKDEFSLQYYQYWKCAIYSVLLVH